MKPEMTYMDNISHGEKRIPKFYYDAYNYKYGPPSVENMTKYNKTDGKVNLGKEDDVTRASMYALLRNCKTCANV